MVRKTPSNTKTSTETANKKEDKKTVLPKADIKADSNAKSEPETGSEKDKQASSKKESKAAPDPFTILIKAQTSKISPKAEGTIGYELVKDNEGILYLRLTSNTSSGNFCKAPVTLQSVIDVLDKQAPDKSFNSKVMKGIFQGKGSGNSNNTSFLMAALRSKEMALTIADSKSPFLSLLSLEFKFQSEQLLNLAS